MRILSKLVLSKWFLFIALFITPLYMWLVEFHTSLFNHIIQGDIKTILVWSQNCEGDVCAPFDVFENGKLKTPPNCPYQNCYVEKSDMSFYEIRESKYDAILFHGSSIENIQSDDLPLRRNPNQIYVFVQLQPADLHPVCQPFFDNFFNWTMTYRLDSDIPWTFFKIKDTKKNVVAPDLYARWQKEMSPVDEHLKKELETKRLLAASLVTGNEDHKSWKLVQLVNRELSRQYNQTVDIYGPKGSFPYYDNETEKYNRMLNKDYFFYMGVEDSQVRDFVTEQILIPLNNNVMPIVWGKTDYEKFLPPGSYIDAHTHKSIKSLVEAMLRLVANRTAYAEHVRWRRHYTLYNTRRVDKSALCQLCKMLNQEQGITRSDNLRRWWSETFMSHCGAKLTYT